MRGGLERVGWCRCTVDRGSAVQIVLLQCVDIADVAVHDCHNRLAMIVGMTKANEMAELVERDAPKVIYRDAISPTSHVSPVRIPIHRSIEDHVVGVARHAPGGQRVADRLK